MAMWQVAMLQVVMLGMARLPVSTPTAPVQAASRRAFPPQRPPRATRATRLSVASWALAILATEVVGLRRSEPLRAREAPA